MNRFLAAAVLALALAACGGGGSSDETPPPPPPPPPPVVVTTFQAASTLIGQLDWTSIPSATPACDATTLLNPFGAVAWDGTDLIVPDTDQGRLLFFSPIPAAEANASAAPAASFQAGEPNLTTCNDASSTLILPQAPFVSGTRLVVADSGLQQVLVWSAIPSGTTAPAVTVGDGTAACAGTSLSDPRGAAIVGTKLIVADSGNHRVLVYDLTTTTATLKLVLGQVESADADKFDLCAANDPDGASPGSTPTAKTMSFPTAVWSDGTKLVVADSGNHRLLLWNSIPTVSTTAADVVIGQADFASTATTADGSHLSSPQSIASDGDQLFVADTGHNRVLVWSTLPTTNGVAADLVLGQGDMTHVAANDDDQNGSPDATPTARTLNGPNGVAVVDGLLAVTDKGNGRVLVYRP